VTTAPAKNVRQEYQTLVASYFQAQPIAPAAMIEDFTQLIQTASPETLTTEKVVGLVTMGKQFLEQQANRVRSGELGRQEFVELRTQFQQGAGYLLSQATWLDAAGRQALESFLADKIGKSLETAAPAPRPSAGTRQHVAERYARSHQLFARASRLIPMAAQTHSKSYHEFPTGASPLFLERGKGARVWDVDGNSYVDLMGALMPISLGYCDPDVDEAIRKQLEKGINLSLATALQVELAEELVELIPCAEMVRYGKNGSDATAAAVRLARAATGRQRIAFWGYHGYHDWSLGATSQNKGIPESFSELTHSFLYNSLESLESLLASHPGEFAAVILEPVRHLKPAPGFLEGCRDLIHKHGGLLIFDEIITGFRYHLGGAQSLFGVTPDLAAFSKSMANGMPLSVLAGPVDLMKRLDSEVFFSVTFGGENLSLAATLATVRKMRREPVIETLWSRGAQLNDRVREEIARHGLEERIQLLGVPCCSYLTFQDAPQAAAHEIRALLLQELLFRGVLMNRNHAISYALGEAEIDTAVAAYGEALAEVAGGLTEGDLAARLAGPARRPIELRATLGRS